MNVAWHVRHDHCGQCGDAGPLFELKLTPGRNAEIVPLEEAGTIIGFCERCLVSRVAHPIRAYFGVEVCA